MGQTKVNKRLTVRSILQSFGIEHKETWEHSAVTEAAVGVCCPFCHETDFHCGVFLTYGNFSCWKCKQTGGFKKLLVASGVSKHYARFFVNKYLHQAGLRTLPPAQNKQDKEFKMPLGTYSITSSTADNNGILRLFVARRKLDVHYLMHKEAMIGTTGKWMNRLIFPITYNTEIKTIVGRDMTGNPNTKPYETESGIQLTNYLYNYDSFGGDVVFLVEGILDALRLGDMALAMFGKGLSDSQLAKLIELEPTEACITLDGDASKDESANIAKKLSPHFKRIKVLTLPVKEDPDSYGLINTTKLFAQTPFLEV